MKKYVQWGYVSRDTSPLIGQRKWLCRAYLSFYFYSLFILFINKTLLFNSLKIRIAMNVKFSVFVICVEVIIYLLLHNLHDCTIKFLIRFIWVPPKRKSSTFRREQFNCLFNGRDRVNFFHILNNNNIFLETLFQNFFS